MLLRPAELLPTFKAGLKTSPNLLWYYYDATEKRVYTADNADDLSPAVREDHFLYDLRAAVQDKVIPVAQIDPADVWNHLWPREQGGRVARFTTDRLLSAVRSSPHFPVLPGREVLWRALREGAQDHRWVLHIPSTVQTVGGQNMGEWPGMPRFESGVELLQYQAALDMHLYPPRGTRERNTEDVTPSSLKQRCWPAGAMEMTGEDLERAARGVWPELGRTQLEMTLRDGVRQGTWCAWQKTTPETFYAAGDVPAPQVTIGPSWSLVMPGSDLAHELEDLRPGHAPQPLTATGTPREALTSVWDQLNQTRNVDVAEVALTVVDRASFENTLQVTWVDRPPSASVSVELNADGTRDAGAGRETLHVEYTGRFDEVRTLLSPVWPFARGGELALSITLKLQFNPPARPNDAALQSYSAALVNANQGQLEVRVTPVRRTGKVR
jgi:hypothetical protein